MPYACWNWTDLAADAAGTWAVTPDVSAETCVRGVVDDSRRVTRGCLFAAIRGELADGHDYVAAAARAGAAAICFQDDLGAELLQDLRRQGVAALQVPDSLAAFQKLARAHRRRMNNLLVVAITGSCGKTTTKEMIAAVLEHARPGAVLKTEGNTNNHFGVPRNLLRLTPDHKAAVIEIGSNHPGEIASLAALVEPDIGVVSNIGAAHLEFFGDLAGVAREKGSLFDQTAWSGVAIYHRDAAHAEELARRAGTRRILTFGESRESDIRVTYLGMQGHLARVDLSWTRTGRTERLTWPLGGVHQALNAGAAAAVGTAIGMEPAVIVDALAGVTLPSMRMEIAADPRGVVWVNDAYNANPDSMRAGIQSFLERSAEVPDDAKLLVLGDMLELGEATADEHARLLDWIKIQAPGAKIIAVGPLISEAAAERDIPAFKSADAARQAVRDRCTNETWVFLKASRGIGLETLLPEDAKHKDV